MSGRIIVVDVLNCFSLLPVTRNFRKIKRVFYFHKSGNIFIDIMINWLSKCGWTFEPIRSSLSPDKTHSVYVEFENLMFNNIESCRKEIFAKELACLSNISDYERARLSVCLGKHAGAELYFATQLFVLLNTKFPSRDEIEAVLLRDTIFSDIITRRYNSARLKTYFYLSFAGSRSMIRENYILDKSVSDKAAFRPRRFIRTLFFLCYSLCCKLISGFLGSGTQIKKHKICVLAAQDSPASLNSCLPWAKTEPNYLKDDILSLCCVPMNKAARNFYKERSDRLVEYNFNIFLGRSNAELILSWADFFGFFIKNLRCYGKLFGLRRLNRWMMRFLVDILSYLSFYEAFFLVNGTRVIWTSNEDDSQTQMAAMAINRLGGVSAGTSWSQPPIPVWNIQRNQNDIYFVWGKRMADIRKENNDLCDFFVLSGYPAEAAFDSEIERARDFRASIIKKFTVKNILTFFNTISGNDVLVSLEDNLNLYSEIFSWLEEDAGNFLVIKAKRKETIFKYTPIKERINLFVQKGRCVILYERSAIYPGLAADIVLSASLSLPSLAAVFNRQFVYFDVHGVSQRYPLGLSNVNVVSEAKELRNALNYSAIESHRFGHSERPSPVRGSVIDPFVDGKTDERTCEYIGSLLKGFESGLSNTAAIDHANLSYRQSWGEGAIVPGRLFYDIRK